MPRPKKATAAPRPTRWNKLPGGSRRPLIDSVWIGEEGRREMEFVARAYKVTLSEVARVLIVAHLGELDVAFEQHRKTLEEKAHA